VSTAAVVTGCRSIAVDDFPASVNNRCPDGFTVVGDRCRRDGWINPPASGSPPGPAVDAGADSPVTLGRLDALAPGQGRDGATGTFADGGAVLADAAADAASAGPPLDAADGCVRGRSSLVAVVAIAAGIDHTCALTSGGNVFCWGSNTNGQLGDGTIANSAIPRIVGGFGQADGIGASGNTTCAVVPGGSVSCWGELARGVFSNIPNPTPIPELIGARTFAGGLEHMCALMPDRSVRCWGREVLAQFGDTFPPATVTGIDSAAAIGAGQHHTCAALQDGSVRCWGDNRLLQNPEGWVYAIPGLDAVTRVAGGGKHSCAIRDGSLWCWGDNLNGQLGDSLMASLLPPLRVAGLTDVRDVAAGSAHTCTVLGDGTVHCWGENGRGQLGDGTDQSRYTEAKVSCLQGFTAIASGARHVCALSPTRGVFCWGDNSVGQLGVPNIGSSTTPVPVIR
jgi:alpha-tubulin suppressor-like RCC1 family protein